jgi:hypothetical protein
MTKIYLPSGLFGDVKNMHFGFSYSTTLAMLVTSRGKSGSLGRCIQCEQKQFKKPKLR